MIFTSRRMRETLHGGFGFGKRNDEQRTPRDHDSESMGTLARGAAVNMVGSGSNIVGRLIFNLLVARLLGASQLGVYFLALTVANVVAVVAVGGMDLTLVRSLAHYRTEGELGTVSAGRLALR